MPVKSRTKIRKSKDPCAELKRKLKERDAELKESREQQAAVSDILRVISGTATDVKPVLRSIAEHAMRLCQSVDARVWLVEGDKAKYVTGCGSISPAKEGETLPIDRKSGPGRAIFDRKPLHIADAATVSPGELPVVREFQRRHGHRTTLIVPLMHEKRALGAIVLRKMVVEPFTKRQIELVQTFADQAAIAIENVRLYEEVRARNAELTETLEQQTATSEILRIISSSPTDTQPVFDAIVKSGVQLFPGMNLSLRLVKGDYTEIVAATVPIVDPRDKVPIPLKDDRGVAPRAILRREVIHAPDVRVGGGTSERAARRGFRAIVSAPMLREGSAIGAISVTRTTPGPFTDKQIALLKTFADQAVIAIENVRLFNETKEALEHQTATGEILRIISSSPTDTQPVFDAIARSGVRLFRGLNVAIRLVNGDRLEQVASTLLVDRFANPLNDESYPAARAVLRRETVNIADVSAEPWINEDARRRAKRRGNRALAFAPMLRGNDAIGVIVVSRGTPGLFTDKEIALLKTFADQAVIAIENVRLFKELQGKNADLTEALEQQTATSDILRVISESPTDTQPVFDTILRNATRLCEAYRGSLHLYDSDAFTLVADQGATAPFAKLRKSRMLRPGPFSAVSQVAAEKRVLHIADLSQWSGYAERDPLTVASVELEGTRTYLGVPLLKDGSLIGAMTFRRQEVRPFTDSQITLLKTFADQAVIAIENVRLFKELQARNADLTESLDRQTATAEILRVISSSPTDIQPVLDAVAESAARLCNADDVVIRRFEGDLGRIMAHIGSIPVQSGGGVASLKQRTVMGTLSREGKTIHIPDVTAPEAREKFPDSIFSATGRWGVRTILSVPLLREDAVIGAIVMRRREVRPFSDKQVELLETFAAQAVIAIENVRLFNETKEALEQQTATAEILKVISSSPTDIRPVFDAILENATRLCDAHLGLLGLYDGKNYQTLAHRGGNADFAKWVISRGPFEPSLGLGIGRMVAERQPIHLPDYREEPSYRERRPNAVEMIELGGVRTYLAVPMLKEGRVVGGITIYRPEVRPFTQRQIDLLSTFASQAVIAIENVRLFNETKKALEQQTATAEILKVISSSPTDVQPVFDAIVQSGVRLFDGAAVAVVLPEQEQVRLVAIAEGDAERAAAWKSRFPFPLTRDYMHGAALLDCRMVDVPDALQPTGEFDPGIRNFVPSGYRAITITPMMRDNRAIGAISVIRLTPGPLSDKQHALLKTFADQAVIAIENVRLFNETKEALEQQTVISEILRVISSSPTDTQPVFDAIVRSGVHLFGGMNVSLRLAKGDQLETVAATNRNYDTVGPLRSPLDDDSMPASRAMLRREVVQIPDYLAAEEWVSARAKERAARTGFRAILSAPMLRENNAIGTINVMRATLGSFTDKQVALLTTFADQAVIAIENVRLFKELQARNAEVTEALEQQTATAEILKVISSSPTDIQPVFEAILENAMRLCGAHMGMLRMQVGNEFRRVAQRGVNPQFARWIAEEAHKYSPQPDGAVGQMIAERRPVHILDRRESPAYRRGHPTTVALVELGGARTFLAVPMLKEGRVVGGISIFRPVVQAFTQKQIDLLSTFADQAVIAIENVRLFKELQARNRELTQLLEQQTATSDILGVISQSPTDVAPVFETIMKSAARLCGGPLAAIYRFDGELLHLVGTHNWPPAALAELHGRFPMPPNPELIGGRVILSRSVVRVSDAMSDPNYDHALVTKGKWRRVLGVPLLRDGEPIGAINLAWMDPGETPESQVALLKTFADQAVIAIENVRLFKELEARNAELTEALEQQTATGEILRVISGSPTDAQPVLDAVAQSAARLCEAPDARIYRVEGETLRCVACYGSPMENPTLPVTRLLPAGRAILDGETTQIDDIAAVFPDLPEVATRTLRLGVRTILATPLLREGQAIGVLVVRRMEVRPFNEKQISLLKTFADQAVIAIENVRLFKELEARNAEITEALEQQTATADILKVISSSPTDIQPVFDSILENATRLCDAHMANLALYEGDVRRTVAQRGGNAEFANWIMNRGPIPVLAGTNHARMLAERRPIQIADQRATPGYLERTNPHSVAMVELGRARSYVLVPMLKEGRVVGGISVYRPEVRAFSQKQVDLVSTFANQAVIAIENVRLFKELQARNAEITEALEQQTATSEVLKVISRSTFDLDPVLKTLVENACKLCNADGGTISRKDKDGNYVSVIERGLSGRPELLAYTRQRPIRPDRGSAVGRAVLERRPVHIPDVLADPAYTRIDLAEMRGFRTVLAVPMLREGEPVGVFVLTRTKEVRPFTDKQVEVVTTFADQAVIAIENVRLFNEIQDKSQQLEIANRHKSQFLANMSHELRTPLNCINGFSEMLLARMFGDLNEKQEEFLRDINSSGEHLLSLINDVLDLSKIEAGRMELHLTAFEPGATLDSTVMLVKERASRRGITVSLEVDERLDRWVGDERKIRQVMLNLLSNSVKFTPEGGRIDVRARRDGDEMVVAVSDTGIGIKPEDQARIFEEFQQAGTDYTKKAEGTGLGLALSRRFVELHGGTLKVESAEGKGSTFTFTLPAMQEATV